MIRRRQTVFGGGGEPPAERGDCFRACIATILELRIEDLPNPHEAEHWGKAWIEALEPFGVQPIFMLDGWGEEGPFPGYWIACLRSGEWKHCVVMRGREFEWDPFPGSTRTSVDIEAELDNACVLLPFDPAIGVCLTETDAARFMEPA